MPTLAEQKHQTTLSNWFLLTAFFVMVMVILGGFTRLTGSGLSMVNWRPITGFMPPLNSEQWLIIFELYKDSPQYQSVNFGMSVDDFKGIFWLEYIHRLMGRFIGILFLIPLIYSLARKHLRSWAPKILGIWLLGGLQGVMGWYMVKSGLIDDPWVSPFRLCAHLLLAFLTASLLVWSAFQTRSPFKGTFLSTLKKPLPLTAFILLILTVCYGAFVAGMKAGLIYNTFPLMGGDLIPEETFFHQPWYINFFNNPVTIQLTHRVLALSTMVFLWIYGVRRLKISANLIEKKWVLGLLVWSLVQVTLGISTLLMHVPHDMAVAHQTGALILLLIFLGTQFYRDA